MSKGKRLGFFAAVAVSLSCLVSGALILSGCPADQEADPGSEEVEPVPLDDPEDLPEPPEPQ